MKLPLQTIVVAIAASFSCAAIAAVSAEEAKQLGTTLTPWGAEKAGNKEGTIPEWTGQVKIPASYDPKKPGVRPDPYANEKPLFTINAQNADKYADKLSDGLKAMLKKYPGFRMDVYPSHRNAVYPQYVNNNSVKNATACKTSDDGLKLEGCYGGTPFPIPKTGSEVMWNHNLSYSAYSFHNILGIYFVDSSGGVQLGGMNDAYQEQPYYDPKKTTPVASDSVYWRFRGDTFAPARKAGEKLILWQYLDSKDIGSRIWQYIPGQRRVKLAPDLTYDTPNPMGGGTNNMDDSSIFRGAIDRFDWKLIGKKEMFIPYNTFRWSDGSLCPVKVKATKNFANPDCVRWELHRTWVVEATLKPQFRHVYKKRKFYFDEDAPGNGLGDNYDAGGDVYRVSQGAYHPMYEAEGIMCDSTITYDLRTGMYTFQGEVAETGGIYTVPKKPDTFFSSEAIAAEGIR